MERIVVAGAADARVPPWEVLGVARNAEPAAVKGAFDESWPVWTTRKFEFRWEPMWPSAPHLVDGVVVARFFNFVENLSGDARQRARPAKLRFDLVDENGAPRASWASCRS